MTEIREPLETHEPAPEFREYLDWELSRAFGHARMSRRLRMSAALLVALALGTTGGLASAQMRENAQLDSLLAAARADATLVSARAQAARAVVAEEQRQVAAGMRSTESLSNAEAEAREADSELARTALNIDEIKGTAKAPRDELNAPLVNGRDFVKDRLQLRLMLAQQAIASAERSRDEAARRVRVGLASEMTGLDAELDVARARRDLAVLVERMALRREFVEKGTAVAELTRRLQKAEVTQDLAVAQRAMQVAQQRATLLERQWKVGLAQELDLMRAKVDVKEREIELQRLIRRLDELSGKARGAGE